MLKHEELRKFNKSLQKMSSYYTYTWNKTIRRTPLQKPLIRKIFSIDFANTRYLFIRKIFVRK